jgi:hypothetical protein
MSNWISKYGDILPQPWYPCFDVVVGLAWSNDPESYVGGGIAIGRSSPAEQVKGDGPD